MAGISSMVSSLESPFQNRDSNQSSTFKSYLLYAKDVTLTIWSTVIRTST